MANTVTIHTKTVDDGGLVELRGQFDSLGKGMASSTAVGVLGAKALGFGIGLVKEAADGAVNAIADSIKAASDLNETIQKSGVVFGSAADEIKRFGEGAADSMGLSENAAIAAAATFGNLFKSLGTAPEKIAPMSEGLVKLASDLASFNNIPVEEALAKLQSGIVGQERPLRELGVAISAASVDVEAANLGFKKINGTFTEGEKVQARYSLIFKQTGTAQGDFARTSDQLANSQRIVNAEMANTSENLGKQLLPAVLEVERGFVKLFDTINGGLPNGIGTAIRQQIETGTLDQLQTSKAALEKAINDPLLNMFAAPQAEALRHQLADVDAAIANFAAGTGVSTGKVVDDLTLVRGAFVTLDRAAGDAAASGAQSMALWQAATLATARTTAEATGKGIEDGVRNAEGAIARARATMAASMAGSEFAKEAHRAGLLAEDAFAQGITARRQAPIDAFTKLVDDLKHPLSAAKETARLIGELTSQAMADGLKSRDQVIHDQALYTKGLIIQELEKIAPQGGKLSKEAAAAVAKGLKSKDPDIRAASQAIYDRVHGIISPLATDAFTWGLDTAKGFARGLSSEAAVKAVKAGAYVPAAAAAAIIDSAGAAWKPAPVRKSHRASGGPIAKDDLYMVGENGPEWFVSDKAGAIFPHGTGPKIGSGTGGGPAGPGGMSGGGAVAVSLYWQTLFPPTPAQAQQAGRLIVPAVAQEMVRRGLIPRRTLSGITG